MKYNLASETEAGQALDYLLTLIKRKNLAEVKVIRQPRSLNQNNYLHLLLGAFGQHFGYTIEEAKTIYKRDVNPGTYVYKKNGAAFLRSSADLDTAEMTKTIDRWRDYSKEQGLPLPAATDAEWIRSMENMIEQSQRYL